VNVSKLQEGRPVAKFHLKTKIHHYCLV